MYEQLLAIFAEHSAVRMTYCRGMLEIMTPLPEHERYSWTIARFVSVLSEELGLEIVGFKSTTWRSKPGEVGKEADECFYIQNEPAVRNKLKIDLSVDPPPDLAIKVDITHSFIDKFEVYAKLKVPEIWQFKDEKFTIYLLMDSSYQESETSLAFGDFPVKEIVRFMQLDPEKGENARMREFRSWVQQVHQK